MHALIPDEAFPETGHMLMFKLDQSAGAGAVDHL